MANLTSKDIKKWQSEVTNSINSLESSLKTISSHAKTLKTVTASNSSDKENLSYRFNDLMTLVNAADKQLAKFMTAYTSDLNNYIKTLTTAEETAAENVRKKIDQFRESASKINKITM